MDWHTWEIEHVCPSTGVRWIQYYTHPELQGGGDPHLRRVGVDPLEAAPQRTYAEAQFRLLDHCRDHAGGPLDPGRIYAPVELGGDACIHYSMWLLLGHPLCPGDTARVLVSLPVEEVSRRVLVTGMPFSVFCRVEGKVAEGEITGVRQVPVEEFRRLFPLEGPEWDWHPQALDERGCP